MDTTTLPRPGQLGTEPPTTATTLDEPATSSAGTWGRLALPGLLFGTALLYFYGLTANGWANAYYSAAVQAGSESWKAFFFGSSDAANSITVDKTPASLWVMALSVRVFGLSSFAILMPQVLMGVGSVAVLHATVRRHFGQAAGLIAGAVLALTPVAVLMFRFNNPDALLVLLMTLGGWATLRAVEKASPKWLVLVGVLVGFGFLTKMLQALLVVPAFALAYLVAAPTPLRKRVLHLLAAGAAMVVSAAWWVAIVELVPANLRPYIGGSQTNSVLELTLGYNGLGRITGEEAGSVGGGNGWGATGLGRMFGASIGGQISWLFPAALLLLGAGLWARGRSPRTDARRAAYLVWGGWLVVTMLVFSLMAGIFHEYYTVALAPAVGAIVGIGTTQMWARRGHALGSVVLAVTTAATAVWAYLLLSRSADFLPWLRYAVLVLGLAAALLLVVVGRVHRRALPVIAATALVAGLAGPAAYSLETVSSGYAGSIVTAGPAVAGGRGFGGPGGPGGFPGGGPPTGQLRGPGQAGGLGGLLNASTPSTEVVSALSQDAQQYTWVAATVGSQNAAGLQLATQLPVMSIGGFNGSDPSPTLAQFQHYVAQGRIHYLLAGGGMGRFGGPGGNGSGNRTGSQIVSWAAASYTPVTVGEYTFYDLTQPLAAGTAS
ncbi:MAG TPA: glycosyltransferase family 39 protein [Dermatophilaceae bacterium]|nr:glycosyltransferase family 39 protein [Dermatophilaceae bacterium]